MIFMYTVVLIALGLIKVLVSRRATSLERKYMRVAGEAAKLIQQSNFKPGNSGSRSNDLWAETAKRQYELARLVIKRDRLEGKHYAWQRWADRLRHWVNGLRNWKGQKLPYTMGVLDIWLLMYFLDHLGVGEIVSAGKVVETVTAYLAQ
jgi:hypothetical protein